MSVLLNLKTTGLDFFNSRRNLIIYIGIGLVGIVLDVGTFYVLNRLLGVNLTIASIISSIVGIVNNFTLNLVFNFKKKDAILRRFASFFTIAMFGLVIGTVIINILSVGLNLDSLVAKIISLIVVFIIQYSLNKRISFK
jgi:putative flippase GtrA